MVKDSPSETDESEEAIDSYSERFHIEFPKYLAMGMTTSEYWDGDPSLAKAYREAKRIKNEETNRILWLQGMYIYEAVSDIAPILQAFAKKGTKAKPYPDHPYALTTEDRKKAKKKEEQNGYNKAMRYMTAIAASSNKRFNKREDVSANGNDN